MIFRRCEESYNLRHLTQPSVGPLMYPLLTQRAREPQRQSSPDSFSLSLSPPCAKSTRTGQPYARPHVGHVQSGGHLPANTSSTGARRSRAALIAHAALTVRPRLFRRLIAS